MTGIWCSCRLLGMGSCLSLLMVLSYLGGVSLGTLVFLLLKINTSKFQFNQRRKIEDLHENQSGLMWLPL